MAVEHFTANFFATIHLSAGDLGDTNAVLLHFYVGQ